MRPLNQTIGREREIATEQKVSAFNRQNRGQSVRIWDRFGGLWLELSGGTSVTYSAA